MEYLVKMTNKIWNPSLTWGIYLRALLEIGRLADICCCEDWEAVDAFPLKERILQLLSTTFAFLNKVAANSFLYAFLKGEGEDEREGRSVSPFSFSFFVIMNLATSKSMDPLAGINLSHCHNRNNKTKFTFAIAAEHTKEKRRRKCQLGICLIVKQGGWYSLYTI